MPEPDLLQRRRELLRTFRQTTAQRAKVEAGAEASVVSSVRQLPPNWPKSVGPRGEQRPVCIRLAQPSMCLSARVLAEARAVLDQRFP